MSLCCPPGYRVMPRYSKAVATAVAYEGDMPWCAGTLASVV
jgi:hypothetical protein